MKMFKCFCSIFLLGGGITTLNAAELTADVMQADAERAAQSAMPIKKVQPQRIGGSIISSVDDVVNAINDDIQSKTVAISQSLSKQFNTFENDLDNKIQLFGRANPQDPLVPILDNLSNQYKLVHDYQIKAAQLEHIENTLNELAKKNLKAATQLRAKYPRVSADLIQNNLMIDSLKKSIEEINEQASGEAGVKITQQIQDAHTNVQNLTEQQVTKLNIQQYENMQGVLNSLKAATTNIPGAGQAIDTLKTMEATLNAIDKEIEAADDTWKGQYVQASQAKRQTMSSRSEALRNQRANLQQQYTSLMKQKYGPVLSKIVMFAKKNPLLLTVFLGVGVASVALVGTVTGVVLISAMASKKQTNKSNTSQQSVPRRG